MSEKPNLDSLFEEAIRIESPEDRAKFVRDACSDDHELRRELEQLLVSDGVEDSFLEKPPAELEATILSDATGDDVAASLDAGLALSFDGEAAVVIGDANHSVLEMLGNTLNEVPRVSLREAEAGGADPISRPNSPEMPKGKSYRRYQLQGELARGGMGAIIKGRDTDLGRDLAIKVLLDSHKDKPEVIQRFVEEAQIGGQLQHPGIAPIYELGQFADQRPFFAMKLVKGQTLAKLLADRKDDDDERGKFIGIFEQVCQTMAYAHSRGVIHRDLKPANVMVGAFGEVQVMDWGLAKVMPVGGVADEKNSRDKSLGQSVIQTLRSGIGSDVPGVVGSAGSETQMGSVMGTPAYMPPEQALGEIDQMDERADVFGLGAILCEILTGQPPYVADDGTRVFRMASRGNLNDCFERLDACGADRDLVVLTKHCLKLEPAERPRNAGELAECITGYLVNVEAKLRATEIERATQEARADAEAIQARAESERAEAQRQRAESEAARRAQQQRSARKLRRMLSALAVVAIFAVGASIVASIYWQKADEHARLASSKAKLASESAAVAIAAQNALRAKVYTSDMNLAQHAFDSGNIDELTQRILDHVPIEGEPDARGVEWYLWWNASHQEQKVVAREEAHLFAVAVSPDGKLVAESVWPTDLQVRDVDRPYRVRSFSLNAKGNLRWLRFSPDGSTLAALAEDSRIHRVSTKDGSLLPSLNAPERLRGLSFSPTRDLVASGDIDGRLYLWDTASLERYDIAPTTDPLPIWSVAFSPTGGEVVAGTNGVGKADFSSSGAYSPLILYDTDAKEIRKTVAAHSSRITSVAWSPDGRYVASGGADESVRIWTNELSPVKTLESLAWVTEVAFSPDGRFLAAATGKDNAIRVWSTETWELVSTLKGHSRPVTSIAFDLHGSLWSVSEDRMLKTWDVQQSLGQPVVTRQNESLQALLSNVAGAMVASDGRTLIGGNGSGPVKRYDLESQKLLPDWHGGKHYRFVTSSDDATLMAAVDEENHLVQAWRSDTDELIAEVPIPEHEIAGCHALGVSRDAKRFAWTTGNPLQLVIVDSSNGNRRQTRFGGTPHHWSYLDFSPNGKLVVVKNYHQVQVLDIEAFLNGSASEPTNLRVGGMGAANAFAFSPDSKLVVSAEFDSTLHVHDLQNGLRIHTLKGHSSEVEKVAFSSDGRRLLSCSKDGTVKIWDVETGESLTTLRGHHGQVGWVGFCKNDREIVSLSRYDATVRTWNIADGTEIQGNALYWTELAEHRRRSGNLTASAEAYDQAIQIAPDEPQLFRARAEVNAALSLNDDAVADYIKLIAQGRATYQTVVRARALAEQTPLVENFGKDRPSSSWRYTFSRPKGSWKNPGFDDSTWSVGGPLFGSRSEDTTKWKSSDIWLRKEIEITEPVAEPLVFLTDCDDDAEFYLNGLPAAKAEFSFRRQVIPCSTEAAATLRPGRNVIAVHCRNTGGHARIGTQLIVLRPSHWIDFLDQALKETPGNIHLLLARSQAHGENGNTNKADADAAAALTRLRVSALAELEGPSVIWPTFVPLLADQLIAVFQSGEPSDRRVIDLAESRSNPWAQLAIGIQLADDPESLVQLLKYQPTAIEGAADLCAETQQWAQAVAFYNYQLSLDADQPEVLVKRGKAYAALGKLNDAKADWRRADEFKEDVLQELFDAVRMASVWEQAAELGDIFIDQDPKNRVRWLNVAPLLVMADDQSGYREFCNAMVAQFADTKDVTAAESTCKACLLIPGTVAISRLPVQSFADPLDERTAPGWFRPWGWATRALVAYRSDDLEATDRFLERGWAIASRAGERAMLYSITALIRQKQGDASAARDAIGQARSLIDTHLPKASPNQLHDWLIPQILIREAERLSDNGPE